MFRLEASPEPCVPPAHRFAPYIAFARQDCWTMDQVVRYKESMERYFDAFDKARGFLDSVGFSYDSHLHEMNEFMEIANRAPFPTTRQLVQQDRKPYRDARDLRVYNRLMATSDVRMAQIRELMPQRKTYKAQGKVNEVWVLSDPVMIKLNRIARKLIARHDGLRGLRGSVPYRYRDVPVAARDG